MTRKRYFGVILLHEVLLAAVAGAAVIGVSYAATGEFPSPVTLVLVSQGGLAARSAVEFVRDRNERRAPQGLFQTPAFGGGFEPPQDETGR